MGYNAAVQVLKNADIYKTKVSAKRNLMADSEAWSDQQQLQTIYHQVIVLDLEYALDKKVEQELWNVGFKHYISLLQEQIRDRKNPKRSDFQALLSWSLEAASGFYISLLQELCVAFDLDVPFCDVRMKYERNNTGTSTDLLLAQSSSCNYICQYCLVHLGDIARYRNQRVQAASFYKHAITLSPNSGQPYNQLALLEASQGDKLSSVYYYVQAIAVKNPFPGAVTNLSSTLATCINKDDYLHTDPPPRHAHHHSLPRFLATNLQAYALLHSSTTSDLLLHPCTVAIQTANATLTALVATKALSAQRLLQLALIDLYMVYHLSGEEEEEEGSVVGGAGGRELVVGLIAGSLSALLLPVYTLKDGGLLEYYALPAIKIILFWIQKHPTVLQEKHFTTRLQIWPSFCKLLNSIAPSVRDFNQSKYHDMPLGEDIEIQGFIPLASIFKKYNFKSKNLLVDTSEISKKLRAARLIKIGQWLAHLDGNGTKLITCKMDDDGNFNFEPCCIQPDPTNEILEEIKSFKFEDAEDNKGKHTERRGGILKPQGSLEKAREERTQMQLSQAEPATNDASANVIDTIKIKKAPTNNVAMQSILKKIEESKQVKFSSETTDKEQIFLHKTPKTTNSPSNPTIPPPSNRNPQMLMYTPSDNKPFYDTSFNTKPRPTNTEIIPSQFSVPPPTHNMFNFPPPNINPPQSLSLPTTHQVNLNPPQNPNMPINLNSPNIPTLNLTNPRSHDNKQPIQGYGNPPPTSLQPQPQSSNIWNSKNQTNWWPRNMEQNIPVQSMDYNSYFMGRGNTTGQFGVSASDFEGVNSPWGDRSNMGGGGGNYQGQQQSMSIRQAMLNEANQYAAPRMQPQVTSGFGNMDNSNMSMSGPGYSLFNPSGWSPNLPGQTTRTDSSSNNRPQSLQQLLDLQNRLKKGDT